MDIRRYFHKGTNFGNITQEQVIRIQNILNFRLRKRLGYITPKENIKSLTNKEIDAVALSARIQLNNKNMDKTFLNSLLHRNFEFIALGYEVYENGYCIEKSSCYTYIKVEYSVSSEMIINLYNNSTYISDSFSLPTEQDDLLDDRIQYGRLKSTDYFSGNKFLPIVCNIFPQSGILRFATPNPLRVLEFTGHYKVL